MTAANARERLDRVRARSWALQVLFRWDTEGAVRSPTQVLDDVMEDRRVSPRRLPAVRRLLTTVEEHLAEIDGVLVECLENWRLERLSRIDRCVLRLSAGEILFRDDVPPKVAINEGIRLAGQYGGDDSSRFVNGVLDAVYRRRCASSS
jgi:transcription antitermination protein NusB